MYRKFLRIGRAACKDQGDMVRRFELRPILGALLTLLHKLKQRQSAVRRRSPCNTS